MTRKPKRAEVDSLLAELEGYGISERVVAGMLDKDTTTLRRYRSGAYETPVVVWLALLYLRDRYKYGEPAY